MIDDVVELVFDVLLGFVPNVVLGAIALVVGLVTTAVGIATLSDPGMMGEALTVVGLSVVAGVLILWRR
ncbi:hypothetical protein DM2_393 [Halorubrum sp. DM2]|uniref:hypothetical protein n=1 Tax=unclassified Halorubrum TaxID=2642239 RepID=UPI0003DCDE89|nr:MULTISPECIES: hypothetical protein [unclassified Halorubrum]CDK40466.1 putative membrane protein [Halorubrum sp. AJ67]VTT85511.1 hypothetical protein DM2_393 [Halorubrum sp. DM2]